MRRSYCELELRIDWLDQGRFEVSVRFMDPVSDEENQLLDPVELAIDTSSLLPLKLDPQAYGAQLTAMLFGDPKGAVREAFNHARDAASTRDGLRIRLTVGRSAPELLGLRWETLQDPRDGRRLAVQDRVWFSRFASAQDFSLPPVGETTPLEALVVAANPSDHDVFGLKAIDAEIEMGKIESALHSASQTGGRPIQPRRLEGPATGYGIVASLRERYADILCLVCHGRLTREGVPLLVLESDQGAAQFVDGRELVERLRDMSRRPRLVLLASCESAADEQGEAMAALGPRLASAGVPSVIAMQGRISQTSASCFLETLFKELVSDGQIDRAVTVARGAIRERDDWWMPVLYLRLKTGRIWPAAVVEPGAFDQWDTLANDLSQQMCVPVLGPGLVESILGSTRELARLWAERYEFPLAPRNRDDLAQVAQYLAYRKKRSLALGELRNYLVGHIRTQYRAELEQIRDETGCDLLSGAPVEGTGIDLIRAIGEVHREHNPRDVHALLARLKARVYVTANRDSLLCDALSQAGRSPQQLLCTWRTSNGVPVPIGSNLPADYKPSLEKPLVFQVFGSLEYPKSLVLTEDDYFDFLINVTRNESLSQVGIPPMVTGALAEWGLLLLGFRADDWDFRVLFRGILRQPGAALGDDYTRVAAQMSPTEGEIIDPDRAVAYLQGYFQSEGRLATFWGSAEQLLGDLETRYPDCFLPRAGQQGSP